MKNNVLTVLIGMFAMTAQAGEDSPMKKLHWLLGQWIFEDKQVNGAYSEQGTRNCILTLDEQYIRCESEGVAMNGHQRSYHFILGYNSMDQRYEMLGLTSSYPRQNLYIIEPSPNGHTLELTNHFWTSEGLVVLNKATITYNGKDQYVWHIRNGEADTETGQRAVGFIDTVTRVHP